MRRCWGADAVLLVPAVVDATTSYKDAWTRSQQVIRERLLPLASELKVIVAVEEVWNKFLLSPLEFARYVDELDSPWLKAYFDVGNVVFYGYPQDWIRSLGRPHREGAPQGLSPRSAERPLRVDQHRRRRHRLARGAARLRRRRLSRLFHDRSRRRRRRLPEGPGGPRRPIPRGQKPVSESPTLDGWTIGSAPSPRKSGTTITSIISWRTRTRFWSSAVTTRSSRRAAPSSFWRGGRRC